METSPSISDILPWVCLYQRLRSENTVPNKQTSAFVGQTPLEAVNLTALCISLLQCLCFPSREGDHFPGVRLLPEVSGADMAHTWCISTNNDQKETLLPLVFMDRSEPLGVGSQQYVLSQAPQVIQMPLMLDNNCPKEKACEQPGGYIRVMLMKILVSLMFSIKSIKVFVFDI